MGAKQSKRSVDISGKEAESAGEVAAAGAGGEGRVEPLADADAGADALKPQLNGDAHIHQQTDKEKQLDIGTPENEKDATTEKEGKLEESDKEKETAPVTNGDSSEPKTENGDSTPAPEETKKPKKEKVKKKWSLRSISFSRKEKPKQEKKQKDEEPKTNGEPEKVPEEAAEVNAETAANDVAEVKSETETKEDQTPETPVTEPITNGSNTPESPKVEIPPAEEPATETVPEPVKTEIKIESEPEKLPINGLSIEEPKSEETKVVQMEETKTEEPTAEPTEPVPAVETPVQKEVCVDQMPVESTPPPLPANPPPSSVASFAATTMAPDLTDASLVNTAETAISTPPVLDTKTNECPTESPLSALANNEADIPPTVTKLDELIVTPKDTAKENIETAVTVEEKLIVSEPVEAEKEINSNGTNNEIINGDQLEEDNQKPAESVYIESVETVEPMEIGEADLLPPPPLDNDIVDFTTEKDEIIKQETNQDSDAEIVNTNYNGVDKAVNGIDNGTLNGNDAIEQENVKNKTVDALGNVVQTIECNGNINEAETELEESSREHNKVGIVKAPSVEEALPPPPAAHAEAEAEAGAGAEAEADFPAPPADAEPTPQEPIVATDKIADLIPEIPVVPDLNTETLQETSDAVVTN